MSGAFKPAATRSRKRRAALAAVEAFLALFPADMPQEARVALIRAAVER